MRSNVNDFANILQCGAQKIVKKERRGAPGLKWYPDLASYMMDVIPEKVIEKEAGNDTCATCEAPNYVGLKAFVERRIQDAADWFGVCLQSGLWQNGEYDWSFMSLECWHSSGKSYDALAKEPNLPLWWTPAVSSWEKTVISI